MNQNEKQTDLSDRSVLVEIVKKSFDQQYQRWKGEIGNPPITKQEFAHIFLGDIIEEIWTKVNIDESK